MSLAINNASTSCCDQKNELLNFRDITGRVTHVSRDELDDETLSIVSAPEVLTVFDDSIDDFLNSRIVEFEF